MKNSFSRQRLSLTQVMNTFVFKQIDIPHIKFDPNVKKQYSIIRTSTHDGTLLFSDELVMKALVPLLTKSSYYGPMGEPDVNMEPMYTIGTIKLIKMYGIVNLPVGRYPGMRERIIIPVSVEWKNKKEIQHV